MDKKDLDSTVRDIDVLLFDGVNLLDVAGPVQAFHFANEYAFEKYRLRYVSIDANPVTASCGLRLAADALAGRSQPMDLLIPGGAGVNRALESAPLIELVSNWPQTCAGGRLISICSGALILAAAGILEGRMATTHWGRAGQVEEQFPGVKWSTDQLYHIDGHIMTSAGVTSGIDLALEIIRLDLGRACALGVARELVVYLKRTGGQQQFAELLEAQFASQAGLNRLISMLHEKPGGDWTLETMAGACGLTARTMSRRFVAATGQTPAKYLERMRVKIARDALSEGASAGHAASVSGFSSFQQMQRAFKRHVGTTVGSFQEKFANGPSQVMDRVDG